MSGCLYREEEVFPLNRHDLLRCQHPSSRARYICGFYYWFGLMRRQCFFTVLTFSLFPSTY
eukprot:IDg22019t1